MSTPVTPQAATAAALRGATAALAAVAACLAGVYLLGFPAPDVWLVASGIALARSGRHAATAVHYRHAERTPPQ